MERITDILDESGRTIGTATLDEAHAKDLLHRSVHVLVVNDSGQVFARKRPADKPIYPDLWTSSVGTHVLHGLEPDQVATSALTYFLGLATPIQLIGDGRVHDAFENEIITVYSCRANTIPSLNPNEGSEGAYMTIEQIMALGDGHKTTPHLLSALKLYRVGNDA